MAGHVGEPGAQLCQRLARMRRLISGPALVALLAHLAQVLGQELVLGGEVPVKRHLVGAGGLHDRIDPDGADAVAIKQLGRGRKEASLNPEGEVPTLSSTGGR
jgi:hypothetical protein